MGYTLREFGADALVVLQITAPASLVIATVAMLMTPPARGLPMRPDFRPPATAAAPAPTPGAPLVLDHPAAAAEPAAERPAAAAATDDQPTAPPEPLRTAQPPATSAAAAAPTSSPPESTPEPTTEPSTSAEPEPTTEPAEPPATSAPAEVPTGPGPPGPGQQLAEQLTEGAAA